MVLWFVCLSIAGVFVIFRDPAMDYRMVAAGALIADPIDFVVRRGIGPLHSVVVVVGLLALVMGSTIGRRSLRRRLLGLIIGAFAHLILDGAWLVTKAFWWPLAGRMQNQELPIVDRGLVIVAAQELIGLLVGAWLWRRFRLATPARRTLLLKTGRIDRRLV
jgi:hypothetical protein